MDELEALEEDKQAGDGGRRHEIRPSRPALIAGAVVLVAAVAVAAVLLSGSSSGTVGERPSWVAHNRRQAQYTAGVSSGWPQYEDDKAVGSYLESAWHDPATWATRYVIDSTRSDRAGSPMAAAQLARVQTYELPGYRERGLKGIRLRGHPAVRWAYDVAREPRVDYFFEECGTHFVARGSSPPGTYRNFAEDFHGMSYSIEANCGE
jgi:hypothetical protein